MSIVDLNVEFRTMNGDERLATRDIPKVLYDAKCRHDSSGSAVLSF